ncbi:uncharacterized protein N7446_013915 [Penicillium canescens]|uniref:uncharacterized protein n=1 Tax=Penicillium canescens TaxID=5083 RepID=UPI0026E09118|nr:uncharacterized protein N7446_013915 [Penicillium canescens]KAJ6042849.1 hypothetical protein N7446_013915 [Penicillium canescens]
MASSIDHSIAAVLDLTIGDDDMKVETSSPFMPFLTRASIPKPQDIIDLTSDNEEDEDVQTLTSEMQSVTGPSGNAAVDNMELGRFVRTPRATRTISRKASGRSVRPSPQLSETVIGGILYRAGLSLELKDGSFLRIQQVDPLGYDVRFTGRRLFRATHPEVKMYIPKKDNELIWVTQKTDSVSIKNVKQMCDIRFTNHRTDFDVPTPQLTCRLKLTIRQQGVVLVPGQHPLTADQTAIEYLDFRESDNGLGKTSIQLRDEWRGLGRTTLFGEGQAPISAAEDIDNDEVIDLTGVIAGRSRAYTFGDAYCGGGGVSCGARQAGLDIKWAVDSCRHAVDTYQRNFEGVEIEHAQFFDFLTNDPNWMRVDICHCSPPCQTFSPAHTVNCNRDDDNSACIFSAGCLCRTAKPRVLTMEETSGLPERFPDIFHRVLLDMVEIGYSLRWAVLRCDDYGVPQERKRLLVIAAGPGEILPHLPQPTHGLIASPGLLPRSSIWSAIGLIPDDAQDHDIEAGFARWELAHRADYNGYAPAKTITCGGGNHNVRKQIGNAVPPLFAKAIYAEIAQCLRESDTKEANGVYR